MTKMGTAYLPSMSATYRPLMKGLIVFFKDVAKRQYVTYFLGSFRHHGMIAMSTYTLYRFNKETVYAQEYKSFPINMAHTQSHTTLYSRRSMKYVLLGIVFFYCYNCSGDTLLNQF